GQRVPLVAGHQVLVPGADGDVRRVMAFGRRIGDPSGFDRTGPRAVGALALAQPLVGPPGWLAQSAGAQLHRALHVVPGVHMPVWPGDRPGPVLYPGD